MKSSTKEHIMLNRKVEMRVVKDKKSETQEPQQNRTFAEKAAIIGDISQKIVKGVVSGVALYVCLDTLRQIAVVYAEKDWTRA